MGGFSLLRAAQCRGENWGFKCTGIPTPGLPLHLCETWANHSIDLSLNFPISEMGPLKPPHRAIGKIN